MILLSSEIGYYCRGDNEGEGVETVGATLPWPTEGEESPAEGRQRERGLLHRLQTSDLGGRVPLP